MFLVWIVDHQIKELCGKYIPIVRVVCDEVTRDTIREQEQFTRLK